MIPVLCKDSDFSVWKRQLDSYCVLKNITDDAKKLAVLSSFVHADILVHASWDSKTTLKNAFESIKNAWKKVNRPDDPIQNFEGIVFSENLYDLKRLIEKAGLYISASEETLVRKFISILPQSLKMAAYQFSPDISKTRLTDLVDHIAKLPTPTSNSVLSQQPLSSAGVKLTPVRPSFRSVSQSKIRSRRDFRCYNCGAPNHLARHCLAPKVTCASCGGRHAVSMCQSSKNEQQS